MKRRSRSNPAIAGALLANPPKRRRKSTRRARTADGRFVSRKRRNPFIGTSKRHPGRVVANVSKRATISQPYAKRPNFFVIQDHPAPARVRRERRTARAARPAPVRGPVHGPRKPRRPRKAKTYTPSAPVSGVSAVPFATLPSQQRKNPFGLNETLENFLLVLAGTAMTVLGVKLIPLVATKLLGLVKKPAVDEKGQRTLMADLAGAAVAVGGLVAINRLVKNDKYKIAAMTGLGTIAFLPFAKRGMEMVKPGSSAGLLGEDQPPLRFDFAVTPASVAGALGRESGDLYSPRIQRYLDAAAGEELNLPIIQGGAAGDELTMPVIQGGAAGDELTMPVIQGDPVFGADPVFGKDNVFGDDGSGMVFGEDEYQENDNEMDLPVIQ